MVTKTWQKLVNNEGYKPTWHTYTLEYLLTLILRLLELILLA
jgi:hypothetical protein